MALFAFWSKSLSGSSFGAGILHGLKLVAVAIVAQAVLGMARAFCPDRLRASIAVLAIAVFVAMPGSFGQVAAILIGAGLGLMLARGGAEPDAGAIELWVSRRAAVACLAAFFLLLGIAFLAADRGIFALFAAFYRSGALVFGGGHVVLPLSRDAVVAPGWISDSAFLAGYGAAQAMPGPLFTFSAYLGAAASVPPGGALGAAIALVGIFLPGILILLGTLPFWQSLRARRKARAAMQGINAAVVGLLAAALYNPVWTSAVNTPVDFAIAAAAFVLLIVWRLPPIAVVIFCALAGAALG